MGIWYNLKVQHYDEVADAIKRLAVFGVFTNNQPTTNNQQTTQNRQQTTNRC